jgi:periplasmic mercuric ion binding protein
MQMPNRNVVKKLLYTVLLVTVVICSPTTWAATKTVKLSVSGMTCAACPITVKKALTKVEGVSQVDVSFDQREAVVTFDDVKTTVQKLTEATTNAGYPSSVKR